MQSGCDIASPGDNCPADEMQCEYLKAVEAVCWAVRRKKVSLLLNATQPSRNKKLSSFAWRELQLEMQTPLNYKADRLYLCLPGTSQHPVYHSWIKLLLVSLFWPPRLSLCLCLATERSLALLAAPGDSAEPCKGRSGRVRGETQWLPGSASP